MSSSNFLEQAQQGWDFSSPSEVREWVESNVFTPRVKRRALTFADQWETSLSQAIADRAESAVGQANESRDRAKPAIAEVRKSIAKVQDEAAHDRLDPGEAMKRLSRLNDELRRIDDVLASVEQSAARVAETLALDPDEYVTALQERFPVAGLGKGRVSLAYLEGREESPFVTQARERRS